MTPLGFPVVPEVYTSIDISWGATAGRDAKAVAWSSASVKGVQPEGLCPPSPEPSLSSTNNFCSMLGAKAAPSWATVTRVWCATRAFASASFRMKAISSRLYAVLMGTPIAPRMDNPNQQKRYSGQLGMNRHTRSP